MATQATATEATATEATATQLTATQATATQAAGEAPARQAKARRTPPKAPSGTLILFVRHGTTPTTGQVLPGRAAGLHLADKGRAEADAVAQRLASLTATTTAPAAAPAPAPAATATAATSATATRAAGAPATSAAALAPAPSPATATTNGRGAGKDKGRARLSIAAVYSSPMERARETAAPIGKALGLKVNIVRGLIEMDFGEWTGAELKALRKLPEWNAVQRYPSGFQFPGGEAFSAMRGRLADTVASLCRRHPGEVIVAVSHADPIKVAVSDALGSHLDLFQRIVISTCSVTAISYSPNGPMVLAVNSTGSLADLRPS